MADARPLAGIRVLESSAYISGPYAAAFLSALGADVVKLEPPKGGDAFRRGMDEKSPYFAQYNAGKRSIAVDLKRPEGLALVKALLPRFDVLIENSRPGKMASLGLGAEDCRAINPRLVYASISGFGDGGPLRDRAAYDTMGQAMSAYYSIMNDAGVARLTGTCIADLLSGVIACSGILASLVGRSQDPQHEGGVMKTSLLEAMSTITVDALTQMYELNGESPTRESRHPQAQNFCLLTAAGGSVTLHLSSSEKFWRALAGAMGREDLLADPRFTRFADRQSNFHALKPIIEAEFMKRTRTEWEEKLTAADVPFAPVLTVKEVADHPQTKWLDILEPERDGMSLQRPPWRFNDERPARPGRTPRIGEHSREIAAEVCSPQEIERLISLGVLAEPAARPSPAT